MLLFVIMIASIKIYHEKNAGSRRILMCVQVYNKAVVVGQLLTGE